MLRLRLLQEDWGASNLELLRLLVEARFSAWKYTLGEWTFCWAFDGGVDDGVTAAVVWSSGSAS